MQGGNSSFSYRHERQEDEGQDLTGVPLLRRRELLKKVLAKNEVIRFSEAVEGEGKRFFELAGQRGLEGIVAKRKDSTYQPGRRSKSWLKIKSRMQQEAVIGGITEPSGSRKHFGALMLGVYDQGKLRYVGHTGTGFSRRLRSDSHDPQRPGVRECGGCEGRSIAPFHSRSVRGDELNC